MRQVTALAIVVALALSAAATGARAIRTTRHSVPTAGVSLATPSPWRAVDSTAVLSSPAMQKLLAENPALSALLRGVTSTGSSVKFLAFDPKVTGRFATNVNVVVTPVPTGVTFAALVAAAPAELQHVPGLASKITTSTVRLPIGPAVKASYRLAIVNGGKRQIVQTLQYIFLRPGLSIVVTCSTTPSQRARRAATFAAIAASIRAS
jgi:hypothetical protein